MVSLNINIGRKEAVFFGVVILVFVVAGLVIGYGGTDPTIHGHSAGEIEGMGCSFGDMEVKNSDEIYQAETDGFVVTSSNVATSAVYVGENSTDLNIIFREQPSSQGPQPSYGSMNIPVKKGLYWKAVVDTYSPSFVYWAPFNC